MTKMSQKLLKTRLTSIILKFSVNFNQVSRFPKHCIPCISYCLNVKTMIPICSQCLFFAFPRWERSLTNYSKQHKGITKIPLHACEIKDMITCVNTCCQVKKFFFINMIQHIFLEINAN